MKLSVILVVVLVGLVAAYSRDEDELYSPYRRAYQRRMLPPVHPNDVPVEVLQDVCANFLEEALAEVEGVADRLRVKLEALNGIPELGPMGGQGGSGSGDMGGSGSGSGQGGASGGGQQSNSGSGPSGGSGAGSSGSSGAGSSGGSGAGSSGGSGAGAGSGSGSGGGEATTAAPVKKRNLYRIRQILRELMREEE